MRNKPNRQSGFTLLELMISMALTAMLLGMLSAGVYTVVNDWQRETNVLDESLDKSLVMLQIERALFAAFPHSYTDYERLARFVYFEGAPDQMSWVSTVSPYRAPGLTAWRLESSRGNGVSLRLTSAFSDNPDARFEDVPAVTILEDYTARFSFLVQRNDEEKIWLDDWAGDEMQSLPIAVYIALTPTDRNQGEVLEILAPIRNWRHQQIEPTIPVF